MGHLWYTCLIILDLQDIIIILLFIVPKVAVWVRHSIIFHLSTWELMFIVHFRHMLSHKNSSSSFIWAQLTGEWFYLLMHFFNMSCHMSRMSCTIRTLHTLVWFNLVMNHRDMINKMGFCCSSKRAVLTNKRFELFRVTQKLP